MAYVYVIRSKTRKYNYVGMTDNPERRLHDHNNGLNKTTKPYAPFELILLEEYPDRIKAREREKFLKTGKGREYIKSMV